MNKIQFHKMVASGNDFIVIDNRRGLVQDRGKFAKHTCPAHLGVGADGVLFVELSPKADLLMRIVNADGSEAEACGNGFRCVGKYAHEILGFPASMTIETLAGNVSVDIKGESIKVKMMDPLNYKKKVELNFQNGKASHQLCGAFINTGVPHAVFYVEGLSQLPVAVLGRQVRNHKVFSPKGTNANFAEVTGPDAISIRTYERGVEAETLACGTGTTAAAIVGSLTGRVTSPVRVTTKSGDILTVTFDRKGEVARDVYLEGSASFVFEGTLGGF
jgi:diaminopimelate epimerase